jgi:hypothetical protein
MGTFRHLISVKAKEETGLQIVFDGDMENVENDGEGDGEVGKLEDVMVNHVY